MNGLLIIKEIITSEKENLALECVDCWGDSHR